MQNVINSIPDGELKAMINCIPAVAPHNRRLFRTLIANRQHMCLTNVAMRPGQWIQDKLRALDPYLRVIWDLEMRAYVIQRIDTGIRAWLPIFYWRDDNGLARSMSRSDVQEILDKLQAGDMQRYGHTADGESEYMIVKRAKADAKKRSNEADYTNRLMGEIDNLAPSQIRQFIEVEKAIASGERIVPSGDDAKFLNNLWDQQKRGIVADIPDQSHAINPGMCPGQYIRY